MERKDFNRLTELRWEMLELLEEARNLLPGGFAKQRAEAYWAAHIETALRNDHGFLGGSMVTMEDTLNELNKEYFNESEIV